MSWDDEHPCPSCGKMHKESEMLSKCEKCGQIYCGDYSCGGKVIGGCPRCGCNGAVPTQWNSISRKWE